MRVQAWNTLSADESKSKSIKIIGYEINASDVTTALDMAEKDAKAWNKRISKKDLHNRVNFITCNGFIRNV